jgi:hypothetical protein
MRSDLKNAFRHAFKNGADALGYTRSSERVFARDLARAQFRNDVAYPRQGR